MLLRNERFIRVAGALAARQRISAAIEALRGGGNLRLITGLMQGRLETAFTTFLDMPTSANLGALAAIEADMLHISATLRRSVEPHRAS